MKPFASRFSCLTLTFGITTALLATPSFALTKTRTGSQANPTSTTAHCTPATKNHPSTLLSSPPCPAKHRADTSVSVGIFSQLTIDRSQISPDQFHLQSTAPSTGTLGTFRQTFHSWLGYSVNLGYSRVSEQYHNDTSIYYGRDNFNIDANMYESSITYVAHTRVNKHYSLFGDIGPGLLTFLPVHRGSEAIIYAPGQESDLVPGVQVRAAGIGGVGLDFPLTRRFELRAEYRALYYRNPDFNTGDGPYSKALTLTSEPTLSLVYHLHQPKP